MLRRPDPLFLAGLVCVPSLPCLICLLVLVLGVAAGGSDNKALAQGGADAGTSTSARAGADTTTDCAGAAPEALQATGKKDDVQLEAIRKSEGLLNSKQYAKALAILGQAIDQAPLNAQLHLWRGNTYWAVCDYRKAIKDFDSAISQNDSSADAYAHKAVCLARLGFYDDAMAVFRLAAKTKTSDATVTLLVSRALFEYKDYP